MGRKRGVRVRRSAAQWREIFHKQEESGLSPRAFCKREGLSPETFRRWREKLCPESTSKFVELSAAAVATPVSRWECELVLPNGACLRFRG